MTKPLTAAVLCALLAAAAAAQASPTGLQRFAQYLHNVCTEQVLTDPAFSVPMSASIPSEAICECAPRTFISNTDAQTLHGMLQSHEPLDAQQNADRFNRTVRWCGLNLSIQQQQLQR